MSGTDLSAPPNPPSTSQPCRDSMPTAKAPDGTEIYFETRGDTTRPTVFIGPHFYASFRNDLIEGFEDPTQAWIDGLEEDFHLLLADYPRGVGKTPNALGLDYSPDVAVEEACLVADAAGVDRFGWVGYSYGAAMGTQLACRTDRLSAFVCGGFPPLNAPFARMVEITVDMAENPPVGWPDVGDEVRNQAVGFYRPLLEWPEREEVARLKIPRMVFMGTEDNGDGMPEQYLTPLAGFLRDAEGDLLELGWKVEWLEGKNHLTAIAPEVALPIVRRFFREVLT